MSLIWKPQPIDLYEGWVEMIRTEAWDDLNKWEEDFIDSIDHQLSSGRNLTESQANKLETIYAEKTK